MKLLTDEQIKERLDNPLDLMVCKEIAQAQLEADIKWLFEPCTEHDTYEDCHDYNLLKNIHPKHRYQCPICMAELKKSEEK